MRHLHALLVGIDDYPNKPLKGCVNDALAWESHLRGRIAADRLSVETLLDRRATRQAIVDTFRSHLGRARGGETALFCFSGHGSQEAPPSPYARQEPDGLSETLVAFDSRRPGGLDLADKELAVLIAEVARSGAHVVVVLDCCHSGTATREPEEEDRVRRMEGSRWARPTGSYWFQQEGIDVPGALDAAGGWRVLPAGRHVLLAACEDHQTAKECSTSDRTRRGLFSYYLLESLPRLRTDATYRDLFKRVQTRVNNLVAGQRPQAEGDLDRTLFDGAVVPRPARLYVRRHGDGSWWLDAGAVHAIQHGTELAVLPAGAGSGQDFSTKLGTARVETVEAARSRVEIVAGTVPGEPPVHPAVVTSLPLPSLYVVIDGSSPELDALRRATGRSPYLATTTDRTLAHAVVRLDSGHWRLKRPEAVGDLAEPVDAAQVDAVELATALEHVARWQALAELSSPRSPLDGALAMTVWEWNAPRKPGREPPIRPLPGHGEARLAYREAAGRAPQARRICVHLENGTDEPLYFALLALDETFAVQLVEGGTGRLPAGRELWIRREDGIPCTVPDLYHARGVTRRRDLLVLLTCSVETDFSPLAQGSLFTPSTRGHDEAPSSAGGGLLETLLGRSEWREIDADPPTAQQWAATSQAVVSVRPMPWNRLDGGGDQESRGSTAELAPGVRLRVPTGLRGAARLSGEASAPAGFPGIGGLPPSRRLHLRPVALAGALGSDPGLSVLELRLDDRDLVSATSPLVLEADLALREDEALAAVVRDGRQSRIVSTDAGVTLRGSCVISSLATPANGQDSIRLEIYALRTQAEADPT